MRLAEFHRLIKDEFGDVKGPWILHSHVLTSFGQTPAQALENGEDPRAIWLNICDDFDIPPERRLGQDL